MSFYRKKPVVIEALQWTGQNLKEINEFTYDSTRKMKFAESIVGGYDLIIYTLEGAMTASLGDYIIKGINGEFYPCKPDIFEKTYEPIGVQIQEDSITKE